MKRRVTILTCMTLLLGIALSARVQMEISKPAPELKKLDYFAGTWTTEGEIKPGPMGSGGKFTGTNHVQWMDGAFFLVTHSEFNGAMGKGAETAYMGYDSDDKMYTYDSFNTPGRSRPRQRQCGRRHLDLAERDKDGRTDHERTTHQ